MLKKIEKPYKKTFWEDKAFLLNFSFYDNNKDIVSLISKSSNPYVYWDKIKYWKVPDGYSNLNLWSIIKLRRIGASSESVVIDEHHKKFTWIRSLPNLDQFLHEVDMKFGQKIFALPNQKSEELERRLLSSSIMEEAIASSQLEGAHTSRKAAKQILLTKKKPQNNSEQMIVNNYQAMRLIEDDLKNKKLDEELLFLLHRTLTQNTLPNSEINRYRIDKDAIVVGDRGQKGEIYHIPPKAAFMQKEIKRFIAYANDELEKDTFVHPVIKAIIMHFWIGYLHPFVDGNGRIARALFYWYLLKKGYWFFGFLPLSSAIKKSQTQYRDAYIYSEQDDNDLTYFIDYNVRKIEQTMRDFEIHAKKKLQETTQMTKIAINKYQLNNRQIQLLRYYYKNKDVTTSITTHVKVYAISRLTAMKDLRLLEKQDFLKSKKVGRTVYYYATDKVASLFD